MARRLEQLARIPVTELRGVGARKAEGLEQLGIVSVLDLVMHYPRRWIDRTRECRVEDLSTGEEAMVVVQVSSVTARRTRNGRTMVSVDVADQSGDLSVTFFNQGWRERQLKPGLQVALFGKVDRFRGALRMTNPVVDVLGDRTGRIVPVYPQSEKAGVYTWDVARWTEEALDRAGEFADPVPGSILERFRLVDRTTAFRSIHQPSSMADVSKARDRLVFDELFRIQLSLVERKRELERTSIGVVHRLDGALVGRFLDSLPFEPTYAQTRVIDEIRSDMARPVPMHRLLQGDVGAGKTVVAVAMLLTAVDGGHQGALMAPTEVLAEQHHQGVSDLLVGMTVTDRSQGTLFAAASAERPVNVGLLTSSASAADRRRIVAGLAEGSVDILIGTHSLIQEGVEFASLGAVVIDEQHRFGVEQRAALRSKGDEAVPDVLVMTATPIPRTAAMTVYGDLDVSVLDEKPGGREEIHTVWVADEAGISGVWDHVREEVSHGRQAYVVCPLVEESQKVEVAAAQEVFADLSGGDLVGLRIGLLHGRMRPAEKAATMELFRSGALDVLVATTVIEVGVDVPNATTMVVLDADRFGIAQLHQLRGRVGRSDLESSCYLVAQGAVGDAAARLEALVGSNDGFDLAEIDLDLRGEGTLMGDRQKGSNDLRLASLRRDRKWVQRAREVALEMVDSDTDPSARRCRAELSAELSAIVDEQDVAYLLKS